jgi:membrane protease YdiL (CAAX protease family)
MLLAQINPPPDDPWLNGITSVIFLASAATWLYLAAKWWRGGVLLEYVPRRPVPWGPVATVLAVALALLTVTSPQSSDTGDRSAAAMDSGEATLQLSVAILPVVFLTAAFSIAVALFSRALPCDLGFPSSGRELARDVELGIVACLAAALPVFGILGVLRFAMKLDEVSHHPLIEIVGEADSSGVLLLVTALTVLVAPVCEEITFRLLLQGWLEKWDVLRGTSNHHPEIAIQSEVEQPLIASSVAAADAAAKRSGWLPIVFSAIVFAAAHFGYGPEPAPIFILALVLGYVYRQTHRIIPCIVAHALFNSISMLILWRILMLESH